MQERLTARMVATRLGVELDTWWAWVTRRQAPQPDGREELSNKPWWYASTIERWEGRRPRKSVYRLS